MYFTKEQVKEIVEFRTGEKVQKVDFRNWYIGDIRNTGEDLLADQKRLRFMLAFDAKVSTMDDLLVPESCRINLELFDGNTSIILFPRKLINTVVLTSALTGVIFTEFTYSNVGVTNLNGYYNLYYADCILAN